MLFHSIPFIALFLVVHQLFWRVPTGYRKHVLLVASLVFYGYWSIPFLAHFLAITVISYLLILWMHRRRSRWILRLAVGLNLANLFFFKYTNSFLTYLAQYGGIEQALHWKESLHIFLPLAISFYTFMIIAFIVDVWRGEIGKVSFLDFTVFITFFPHLIAGPIMRHVDFLPQLDAPVLSEEKLYGGIYLFLLGVAKKVFIADPVSDLINPIWSNPGHYDSLSVWMAVIGFSAQVYADFSGYTDMARGLARLLGYEIPENFYSPYLSTSFAELWKRWHVTLSTWLRDYLYIPLGGSRVGKFRLYLNLLIVMSLGGLWHGSTFNFFLWGFVHGLFLIVEKLLGYDRPARTIVAAVPRMLLVSLGWSAGIVFFRGADPGSSMQVLERMVGMGSGLTMSNWQHVLDLFLLVLGIQTVQKFNQPFHSILDRYRAVLVPAFSVVLFFMLVRIEHKTVQFIYFQF